MFKEEIAMHLLLQLMEKTALGLDDAKRIADAYNVIVETIKVEDHGCDHSH
ncbi:MAG: hypothetical protein AAGU11_23045 [Syntrophobacteraceae bacterium]